MNPIESIKARFIRPWKQKHFERTRDGKRLKQYYNKHRDERCFIVANGPSLRTEDLELLHKKGEITFAMNRIFKIFPETNWRPTYYVCEDELIAKDCLAEINVIEATEKFIPIEIKWWHDINIDNALYFHLNYKEEENFKYGFSTDIPHQIDCRGTVTCTCLQLAAYMGFSEIYLIGVDHNFQKIIDENGNIIEDKTVKDYFIEGYDADIKNEVVHDMGHTTRSYIGMKKYCDESKRTTIYNATRGGKLEVFQRVDFDTLFTER